MSNNEHFIHHHRNFNTSRRLYFHIRAGKIRKRKLTENTMQRFKNTSGSQDSEIKNAQSTDHISNLLAIIEDLDNQLTEWKNAADSGTGCDTPEGLRNFINSVG